MDIYWELRIDRGEEGTNTVEYYDKIKHAIVALKLHDDPTAFIDAWSGDQNLGQTLTKTDL